MQDTQTNQPETTAARQVSGNGGKGGASQNQQVTRSTQQQSRGVARSQSSGRDLRPLWGRGSRELASTSPSALMRQLSREMDRLMDSFFDARFGSQPWDTRSGDEDWRSMWTPRIDVQRRNDAIVVRADLPGVRKEDVEIEVEDNALILSGERREEREEGAEDQDYHFFERSYGSFYRAVPLPEGTNLEEIKAEMRDGVLSVTVPLSGSARPRRIKIES
jgi:HSP20 family protein